RDVPGFLFQRGELQPRLRERAALGDPGQGPVGVQVPAVADDDEVRGLGGGRLGAVADRHPRQRRRGGERGDQGGGRVSELEGAHAKASSLNGIPPRLPSRRSAAWRGIAYPNPGGATSGSPCNGWVVAPRWVSHRWSRMIRAALLNAAGTEVPHPAT